MNGSVVSSPVSPARPVWRDPQAWIKAADISAVLIALALPWSTSLVGIFSVVWVICVVPTIDVRAFVALLKRPICVLPVALFALAVVGTLVVGRGVGRAALCHQPDRETAGAADPVLSLPAFVARHVGIHGVPDLLQPVDGDVMDRRVQSRPLA